MAHIARTNILLDKMAEAVQKSTAIDNFVRDKFSDNPVTIYVGFNDEEQPAAEEYPIIVFSAIERAEKGDSGEKIQAASVGIAIKTEDTEATTADPTTGAVIKKYHGLYWVEDLRELVCQEILTIKGIGAKIDTDGETLIETFYPIFKSTVVINFEEPKNRRSGRN